MGGAAGEGSSATPGGAVGVCSEVVESEVEDGMAVGVRREPIRVAVPVADSKSAPNVARLRWLDSRPRSLLHGWDGEEAGTLARCARESQCGRSQQRGSWGRIA